MIARGCVGPCERVASTLGDGGWSPSPSSREAKPAPLRVDTGLAAPASRVSGTARRPRPGDSAPEATRQGPGERPVPVVRVEQSPCGSRVCAGKRGDKTLKKETSSPYHYKPTPHSPLCYTRCPQGLSLRSLLLDRSHRQQLSLSHAFSTHPHRPCLGRRCPAQ